MEKTPINKVSANQKIELAKRRKLKLLLFEEQQGLCAECVKQLSYRSPASDNYPHLSHKIPLSQGGKTTRENCTVNCAKCHSKEHNLSNTYNEQPGWRE